VSFILHFGTFLFARRYALSILQNSEAIHTGTFSRAFRNSMQEPYAGRTLNMANEGQMKRWNGPSGRAWVTGWKTMDAMFKPFQDILIDAVHSRPGARVLDVGCGTGGTTIAIACKLGRQGKCIGIDISAPMISMARHRGASLHASLRFVCADAQLHDFGHTRFDMIVSRFGVMFFDDPQRAFLNLRAAAAAGAELRFIVWRSAEENSFLTTADRAAAKWLPNSSIPAENGPGPFGLANRDLIATVLTGSGWREIFIHPLDVTCVLPEKELVWYLSGRGAVGLVLQRTNKQEHPAIMASIRSAYDPFVHGAEVRYTAACWMVSARA
jgi:SAM-dependent methyltransferase